MRQEDEADGPQDTGKAQEPEGSAEKAGSKKDKYQKAQAKAEHTGEKLGKAREKLDKTEAKRAAKKPPGLAKKAVRGARAFPSFSPACSAFACAFWYLSFLLPAFSAEPSGSCALPVSCGPPASSSCLMRSEGRLFRLSS